MKSKSYWVGSNLFVSGLMISCGVLTARGQSNEPATAVPLVINAQSTSEQGPLVMKEQRSLEQATQGPLVINEQRSLEQVTPGPLVINESRSSVESDYITISADDMSIVEVFRAFSMQTGQSIVIGPDVVDETINVRLNNIRWDDALEVILKPYGFGYRLIGHTIVISRLDNILSMEDKEPLLSRVFKLRFLDAYDVQSICEAQLSERGSFTLHSSSRLAGWEFSGGGGSGGSNEGQVDLGMRERKEQSKVRSSKTIVIHDIPSVITKIENILIELDHMPIQVLIETQFMEVSAGAGSKIGVDYVKGVGYLESITDVSGEGLVDLATGNIGGWSQSDGGIQLAHLEMNGDSYEMFINFLENDENFNLLSAPRVLAMNNREASILVGQKYPIISSQNNSGSGSSTTSTQLEYYENIGIQLNVIPQVCEGGYVNLLVHPVVSEIEGFETGVVFSGGDQSSGTPYPILKIREAETQVVIKSGNTVVIGGLQTERASISIDKVPFLGSIPFIGRLFRTETKSTEKIDLLIFIKATIINTPGYARESLELNSNIRTSMTLLDLKPLDEAGPSVVVLDDVSETALPEPEQDLQPIAVSEGVLPEPEDDLNAEPVAVSEEALNLDDLDVEPAVLSTSELAFVAEMMNKKSPEELKEILQMGDAEVEELLQLIDKLNHQSLPVTNSIASGRSSSTNSSAGGGL